MSSDGMIMDISNKNYSTYYPMKKEDIVYADDWEIIEKVLPKPLKVDFFEAYQQMRKGKLSAGIVKTKHMKKKISSVLMMHMALWIKPVAQGHSVRLNWMQKIG